MSKITDVRSALAGLISFVLLLAVVFSVTVRADKMADEAPSPADLNDLEIAHVAYTADVIDIRYAHLALAKSKNPEIHDFAKTMIRDHEAVNTQALALLEKLGAQAQDNFLSKQLNTQNNRKGLRVTCSTYI